MTDIKLTTAFDNTARTIAPDTVYVIEQKGNRAEIVHKSGDKVPIFVPGSGQEIFDRIVKAYSEEYRCVTRAWKVYGADGHDQKEAFRPSVWYNFSCDGDVRLLQFRNGDTTGAYGYSEVVITRNTAELCEEELSGQLTDGAFENNRVGEVVEVIELDAPPAWINETYVKDTACTP